MFLPIDRSSINYYNTGTYISLADCQDGLKGQELHDLSQKMIQARNVVLLQMQTQAKKKVLYEEMAENVDDYLEAKLAICKKFQKSVFQLQEPKDFGEQKVQNLESMETEEIRNDWKTLKKIIGEHYKY